MAERNAMPERSDWFRGCTTVASMRALYHVLAKSHHPDLGAAEDRAERTLTMQSINAAYERGLFGCDGETTRGDDGAEHVYHYNAAVERALYEKVAELLKLLRVSLDDKSIRITQIGVWLWVTGDTRPVKDTLKAAGLWYNGRRQAWSFHVGAWRGRSSTASLNTLAWVYGSREYEAKDGAEVAG